MVKITNEFGWLEFENTVEHLYTANFKSARTTPDYPVLSTGVVIQCLGAYSGWRWREQRSSIVSKNTFIAVIVDTPNFD